jgi:PadR family transcriptional regulator, regulatory protein PadR
MIFKGAPLGQLEHVVMLALTRLGGTAYGMEVRREIREKTGREISIGAVYTTLDRLEGKGLLQSVIGQPVAERGGRARRTFHVTPKGARALRDTQAALDSLSHGLFPEGRGA